MQPADSSRDPRRRVLTVTGTVEASASLPRRERTLVVYLGTGEPVRSGRSVPLIGEGPNGSDMVIEERR